MSIVYAIPFFVLSMLIEWRLLVRRAGLARVGHVTPRGYWLKDTAASLTMGIVHLAVQGALMPGIKFLIDVQIYENFRLATIPPVWWGFVLTVVVDDFRYYWWHRLHHEVRVLWAAHVNHHSAESYNLSTALRQSWTTWFTGLPFRFFLPLLGFHPATLLVASLASLLYQYWIHTELIGSMGPFGWLFNTPSHHRVHHARNGLYLDRNHAGIFIVWDRLFGTFQAELPDERPDYGLTRPLTSYNPLVIAFHEWVALGRDITAHPGATLGLLFGPPGWKPGDRSGTAKSLREVARVARAGRGRSAQASSSRSSAR